MTEDQPIIPDIQAPQVCIEATENSTGYKPRKSYSEWVQPTVIDCEQNLATAKDSGLPTDISTKERALTEAVTVYALAAQYDISKLLESMTTLLEFQIIPRIDALKPEEKSACDSKLQPILDQLKDLCQKATALKTATDNEIPLVATAEALRQEVDEALALTVCIKKELQQIVKDLG